MIDAEHSLDTSRRQIIRALALVIMSSGIFVALLLVILLLMAPSLSLTIILVFNILDVVACAAALVFVKNRPLWQSILPLAITLTIAICGVSLLFPDIKTSLVPLITLVALLVSMIGNSRLTLVTVVCYVVLAMAVVAIDLPPTLTFSFGASLRLFQALSAGVTIVLIWVISDRLTGSLTRAMAATGQRAAEAEAARAEAEAARAELEQRSAEQERLLELVQTLELPIIPIGEGVLVVPLVGNLDTHRIEQIQRRLLAAVSQQRTHTVVLDVTGISVLDTGVALRLLQIAQATLLLGSQTLLSGISAHVAQTLVSLGVALDGLQPVADLGQALETARQKELGLARLITSSF